MPKEQEQGGVEGGGLQFKGGGAGKASGRIHRILKEGRKGAGTFLENQAERRVSMKAAAGNWTSRAAGLPGLGAKRARRITSKVRRLTREALHYLGQILPCLLGAPQKEPSGQARRLSPSHAHSGPSRC